MVGGSRSNARDVWMLEVDGSRSEARGRRLQAKDTVGIMKVLVRFGVDEMCHSLCCERRECD